MAKTSKDVTMDLLKGTARVIDHTKMINDQYEALRDFKRNAGSNPSKVSKDFFAEQEAKIEQLQDIVKRWVQTAYHDDEDVYSNTQHWSSVERHYNITVMVEKK